MKFVLTAALVSVYAFGAVAEDNLVPGSLYCNSVIALETKNYQDQKSQADKILNPMIAQLKSFLAKITPAERSILQVEGDVSEHIQTIWKRAEVEGKKYSNKLSECPATDGWILNDTGTKCDFYHRMNFTGKSMPAKKGIEKSFMGDSAVGKDGKAFNFISIHNRILGTDTNYDLKIQPSTPDKELMDIETQKASHYLAPALGDYIKKHVNAKCLNDEILGNIYEDDRQAGKDVPETGKKGKPESKSGAVKN